MCARRPARVVGIVGPGGRFGTGRAGAHVHSVLLSAASEALERGFSNVERGAEDPARLTVAAAPVERIMLGIAAPAVEGEVAQRRVVRTTSGAAGGGQKEPVPVSCLDERQERHGAENEDRDGHKDDSDPQLHVLLR